MPLPGAPSTRLCRVKLSKMHKAPLLEFVDKLPVKSSAASGMWRSFSKSLRKKVSAPLRNDDTHSISHFPRSWQMRLLLLNWENRTEASSPTSDHKATSLLLSALPLSVLSCEKAERSCPVRLSSCSLEPSQGHHFCPVSSPLHPLFVLFLWRVPSSYRHAQVSILKKHVTRAIKLF